MHWNKSNVKPRKYCVKINKNCNNWRGYHAKGLVGGISSSYSNMNMMREWCTIDKPVGRQEGRVQWNSIVQMKIRSLKKEKGNKRHWIWWYSYYIIAKSYIDYLTVEKKLDIKKLDCIYKQLWNKGFTRCYYRILARCGMVDLRYLSVLHLTRGNPDMLRSCRAVVTDFGGGRRCLCRLEFLSFSPNYDHVWYCCFWLLQDA